jgi:sugar phosphate isomerase/epimerase
MRAILGTIALEPNRWTLFKEPATDLIPLLPRIRQAGFDQVEVWQNHLSLRPMAAVRALKAKGDEAGVAFTYIGVYPSFVAAGPEAKEQERIQEDLLDKAGILGTRRLKIMLGTGLSGGKATPEQVRLTADRFGRWYRAATARGIRMAVELHGGTLFDPVEVGERFMQEHPELDFTICFQPYDFYNTDLALALADRFAGRISHVHLQAPQPREKGRQYDLLEEGSLDYRRLLPHILRRNPGATMTLEFVKDCIQPPGPFDVAPVLANARRDADFVERILSEEGL